MSLIVGARYNFGEAGKSFTVTREFSQKSAAFLRRARNLELRAQCKILKFIENFLAFYVAKKKSTKNSKFVNYKNSGQFSSCQSVFREPLAKGH